MSATLLDVEAVRSRYTALQRRLAFFDGPGGTQCPDSVIDAIADYLRHDNANVGAPYETSRRTSALVDLAHERAARVPRLRPRGGRVRAEHDGAQLPAHPRARPRARAAATRCSSRGSTTTPTSRRGCISQHDLGIVVRLVDVHDDLSLDLDSLEAQLSRPDARRRVPGGGELGRHGARRAARSWSSRTRSARSPGPTRCTSGRTARSTSPRWGVDVLLCSPYKFFGPHMGIAFGRDGAPARAGSPTRSARRRTSPSDIASSSARASTSCSPGFVAAVDYVDELGWEAITAHERALGQRFLDGLPDGARAPRPPDDGGPRADVLLLASRATPPEAVAEHLAHARRRRLVGQLLRARDDPAPRPRRGRRRRARRDRALQHGRRGRPAARRGRGAAVRLLLLGGPKFLGRAVLAAALARGHEVTTFNRGRRTLDLHPEVEQPARRPRRRARCARRTHLGRRRRHLAATSHASCRRARSCSRDVGRALRLRLDHLGVRVLRDARWTSRRRSPCSPTRRSGGRRRPTTAPLKALVRDGGRGRRSRARATHRPRRADRRAARPHGTVHVLAPPRRARRRRCSSPRRSTGRCSSSTCATSAPGWCAARRSACAGTYNATCTVRRSGCAEAAQSRSPAPTSSSRRSIPGSSSSRGSASGWSSRVWLGRAATRTGATSWTSTHHARARGGPHVPAARRDRPRRARARRAGGGRRARARPRARAARRLARSLGATRRERAAAS